MPPSTPPSRPRHSLRLKDYDYRQVGAYFVTICTHQRRHLFGTIAAQQVRLNPVGQMVQDQWDALPQRFPGLALDARIVMPNHLHAILWLTEGDQPLGQIISAFKSLVVRAYIAEVAAGRWPPYSGKLWQRNYHEHVIRTEERLEQLRDYTVYNPSKWEDDPGRNEV